MVKYLHLFLFCTCLYGQQALAQNQFHPWGLGISYNVSNMEGLFDQRFFKVRNYSGGVKLHVSRYLSPSFNVRLEGTYASIYYPQVTFYPTREKGVFNQQNFFETSFLFEYKLNNNYIFKENAYVQPYLFIGLGTNTMNKDWNAFFPWGAGFKIKCTKWMAVNLETCFKVNIDNSFNYLQHNAGLIFSVGKAIKKANTTAAIEQKVKEDLKDLEINNVQDSDKDGVLDANDECPFLAGSAMLSGCPDQDADGVADSKDLCPGEKGSIENKGCPAKIEDGDADGVADAADKCPLVAGPVSNNGCPISLDDKANETVNNSNNLTSLEVFYNTSSAMLSANQKEELDAFAAANISKAYSRILICGYTSNTGNKDINIKLSMDRALNVLNYLASKGFSPKLMNIKSYGPYEAKYDNTIPNQSIKNQRVEITIK